MAHSPAFHDRGTRFTNYSSIHSADAFVGEYQVMYTPGSTSPQQPRANRKSSRFSRTASSSKPHQNVSQSYLLPSDMPNTSQIMPDHGPLPNIQVHYNIPADEKQIVASLRALQRDLAEAVQTIATLTRERDDALQEIRMLKSTARKLSSPASRPSKTFEDELFDLSSPIQESPKRSGQRLLQSRKEGREQKETQVSDEARVISTHAAHQRHASIKNARESSKQHQKPVVDDTKQSVLDENPTAASNTSRRRRRHSLDENMTSAYIIPDITVEEQVQSPLKVSRAAQNVLHSLDPEHINNCDVCHRLTKHIRATERERKASKKEVALQDIAREPPSKVQDFASFATDKVRRATQPDYTAVLAGFTPDDSVLHDQTMRPKVSPDQALTRVRVLMDAQFRKAKERHGLAWEKYNKIEAPLSSKKHSEISKEMQHWAEKMEECRVHLDYLRDVEEGMRDGNT
ncbi:hypothetical protein LTR05_001542 [Lithohypha guttulata]|uniref:Cep57 centrosome microtubule-binding domain-containing protein n=1 Tax=Lithohypha guttulata TaxID=1690604 RepID=A0AAN7T6M5_9EURO|nr:hypothetical protein LTR05_001542 [Lithohypha guttulata]